MRKICTLILLIFLGANLNAQTGTIAGGGNSLTPCPGMANVLVYSFSLAQSGSGNQAVGFNFNTSAGSSAVVSSYYVWLATSAGNSLSTLPANAFLLGSVQNFGPGTQTIPTLNTVNGNYYDVFNGTTYYIYITANVLNSAPAGSTITVTAPTVSNILWAYGESNGGNTATNATTTVASGGSCLTTTYYSYNGGPPTTSGSVQQYVVPPGVTSIGVDVAGAVGGTGAYYNSKSYGGMGGVTSATLTVTPGTTLYLYLGNVGGSCLYTGNSGSGYGGSNSGGGAHGGNASWFEGGGGGGSTDIRTSIGSLGSRIVIGGGGGGGSAPFVSTINQNYGGGGGNPSGGNGIYNGSYDMSQCGNPGTLTCCASAGSGGTSGALGAGGDCPNYNDGGGGGGGYYGASGAYDGGACGGSSFAQSGGGVTVGAISYANGSNTGPGYVIIRQLCTTPPASTGLTSLCVGGATLFSNTVSGGTWSVTGGVASIVGGTLTATGVGSGNVQYSTGPGCTSSTPFTVAAKPSLSGITTNSPLCAFSTLNLNAVGAANVTGYAWTGPATVSNSTMASAMVSSIPTSGNGTYSVAVINGTGVGCAATYTAAVTLNTSPEAIVGAAGVCVDATNTLSNVVTGGTWSVSSGEALINSSGELTGVAVGTTTVSYIISSGCYALLKATVNPLPVVSVAPSVPTSICINQSTTFVASSAGNTLSWSGVSGATGLACASCGANTFTPTAVGTNVYSVTATTPLGCTRTSGATVIVNPLPEDITGNSSTCIGTTVPMASATPGGTWSGSMPSVAFINNTSGLLSPLSVGATTITYTSAQGCVKTRSFSVVPSPDPIIGSVEICTGSTATLAHSVSGGSWNSGNNSIATVGLTGVVTGVADGLTNITYTLPTGCRVTSTATINALPSLIGGPATVCVDQTVTLTNSVAGGTWSSPSANVSVGLSSGSVTGLTAGTASIIYMMPTGCSRTMVITVNPLPAAITGTASACQNGISNLSDATSGGVWASGNTAVANVDPSGMVIGIAPGFANISYSLNTGCRSIVSFQVHALPSVIGGTKVLCEAATTTLDNTDIGGTWTSSNAGIADVDASSGVVTGAGDGTATITYTSLVGCRRTAKVTVNPLPGAFTGTTELCSGSTTTLSNATPGGVWSSDAVATANIDASGNVLAGVAGQANISYELATGCRSTTVITVNPLPAAITGVMEVCVGQATNLLDASIGGSWISNTPTTAGVNASGAVTGMAAGSAVITYTLPTGCAATATVTVNPLPAAITGASVVCKDATTKLNNFTSGGTWTSEFDLVATVNGSGVVTGVDAGVTNITYTLGTGCYRTKSILVDPLPDPIAGTTQVCVGLSTSLSSTTTGGTWLSGNAGIVSISNAGLATGITAGTTDITYTAPTGCRTSVPFVVNPLPANITGPSALCVNASATLNNTSLGGVWFSGNTGVATIDNFGVVSGSVAGTSVITYTLPTGCMKTKTILVNPLPATITGVMSVCQGLTTTLANTSTGGAWSSSTPSVAAVNASGVVSGASAGNAVITYTLPTSCRVWTSVIVNPLPADITGITDVCAGQTTTLSDATLNGMWISGAPLTAAIDASGTVSGFMAGSATITYELPTGCRKYSMVNVNPLPAAITGAASVCEGLVTGLSNATAGGSWTSSNMAGAPINASGVITGIAAGGTIITYTLPTGCSVAHNFMVDPIPAAISGPSAVCAGSSALMTTTTTGGFWGSASPLATISYLGEVTGISAGTVSVTYMLPSGCLRAKSIVVNPLPSAISGATSVCEGAQTTLGNTIAGGNWTTNSAAIASINATSGAVTGVAAGMAAVTYTLPTGCMRSRSMAVNVTPAPISGALQVCRGANTTLSTTSTGGIWVSGNTSVALAGISSGNISGISTGTAAISYVMNSGCQTVSVVTVNPQPAAISGILSVCEGASTVLSNATLGGTWSTSGGSVASISAAGVINGMSAGNEVITYMLPTGCYSSSTAVINALPAIQNVTGGGSICAGSAGVELGLDGSAGGTTYKLYNGTTLAGTFTGSGAPVFFGNFTAPGTYMVTARTSAGCSRNMAGMPSVTVIPVVTPSVMLSAAAGDTLCAGSSATFNTTATNGGTSPVYTWKVNGSVMSASGSDYMYTPANGDVVSVELASDATCAVPAVVSDFRVMTVMTNETPSVAISVSPSESICKGTTTMFTATAVNGGSHPAYSWIKNGSSPMGTGATLSYAPSDNDVIVCWLNSDYRCLLVDNVPSNGITMNVDEVYIPSVEIVVTPGTTINKGEAATFTAVVANAGPAPVYTWLKNGIAIGGAMQSSYTTSNIADGDSITCMVKGSGLCGQTSVNSVSMSVLTGTGFTTQTFAAGDIRLSPNPNNGTFTITGHIVVNAGEPVNMVITDMLGQVVYTSNVSLNNGLLNERIQIANTMANGMYLLNITAGGERKALHFVVKQ